MSEKIASLKVLTVLGHELTLADEIRCNDPYFRLRVLVRVVFSTLDAVCFYLKSQTLTYCKHNEVNFSENEKKVLYQEMVSLKKNLLISFRCYSKIRNVECPFFRSGDLPSFLKGSIEIRNRLTHPKFPEDFNLSSEESNTLNQTTQWLAAVIDWVDSLKAVGEKMQKTFQDQAAAMGKSIQEQKERYKKITGKEWDQ